MPSYFARGRLESCLLQGVFGDCAGVTGLAQARPLSSPALLPHLRDPEPSLPSLPAPESCARWDRWAGARGYPALATHPALRKGPGFPTPSLEDLGAGGLGGALAQCCPKPWCPCRDRRICTPNIALRAHCSLGDTQISEPRRCSSRSVHYPRGRWAVLGGGPGARLATPAGGLARGPSPGGGDRLGSPSLCGRRSRRGLWGEQSQPGVRGTGGRDRASPPYPSLGPRETLAPLSATRNTGWRGTPTGAELWVLPPPSSPPAPNPRKGGHGLLFPSGGHELLLQVKRWIRQSHTPAGDPWPGCGARLTLLRPGAWVGGAPQTDPIPGLRGPVCL